MGEEVMVTVGGGTVGRKSTLLVFIRKIGQAYFEQ